MYNLEEQFMNLSNKQIKRMIQSRIEKYSVASELLEPLEIILQRNSGHPKIQARADKQSKIMNDIDSWFSAAYFLFSAELWDEMADNWAFSYEVLSGEA